VHPRPHELFAHDKTLPESREEAGALAGRALKLPVPVSSMSGSLQCPGQAYCASAEFGVKFRSMLEKAGLGSTCRMWLTALTATPYCSRLTLTCPPVASTGAIHCLWIRRTRTDSLSTSPAS
jgi:hypothetical protein